MQIQVNAADVIIVEGILVFHDACVRGLMNMKIFVDTGLSVVDISPLYLFHRCV
jgi:uridine kinase